MNCAGADGIDGLAATAAERALDLREQTAKRARPLKKKALTDFLKALLALGVSRNRTAVPAEQRGAHSWCAEVGIFDNVGNFEQYNIWLSFSTHLDT